MKTLNNWYMVELTDTIVIGTLNDGREHNTTGIVDVDIARKILVTKTDTYKLGDPDEVWWKTFTKYH